MEYLDPLGVCKAGTALESLQYAYGMDRIEVLRQTECGKCSTSPHGRFCELRAPFW